MDRFIVWALLALAIVVGGLFLNSTLGYETPTMGTQVIFTIVGGISFSLWERIVEK